MLDISGSRETVSGGRDTREVRILFFPGAGQLLMLECLVWTESGSACLKTDKRTMRREARGTGGWGEFAGIA